MSLYEDWLKLAYDKEGKCVDEIWDKYMPTETNIYKQLISEQIKVVSGTVKELGARYHMQPEFICGFIDGINGAIKEPIELDKLEADDFVKLEIDYEMLYKKMVEYRAEHLYNLPEWNAVYTPDQRKMLYLEQKKSGTVIREAKPGRNDLCNCGSGKKYKKCCGVAL